MAGFAHVRLSGCGKQALPELSMCLLTREQGTDLSRHPVLLCVCLLYDWFLGSEPGMLWEGRAEEGDSLDTGFCSGEGMP